MNWKSRRQKRILLENSSHIGRDPQGLTFWSNKSDKRIKYVKWDHQIIIGDYL